MAEWVAIASVFLAQIVGLTAWSVGQAGKIKLQEQRVGDLEKLINARFDAVEQRLERIEVHLNGQLR